MRCTPQSWCAAGTKYDNHSILKNDVRKFKCRDLKLIIFALISSPKSPFKTFAISRDFEGGFRNRETDLATIY